MNRIGVGVLDWTRDRSGEEALEVVGIIGRPAGWLDWLGGCSAAEDREKGCNGMDCAYRG